MQQRKNQSGQALLEYVALLLVSVLIIIGAIWKYNDAFRQFLGDWAVGENSYLYCLIQNGALPWESDVCTLPTFNINKGKELPGGVGGGGGGTVGKGGTAGGGGKSSLSGDRVAGGGRLIPYGVQQGGLGANGGNASSGGRGGKNAGGAGGSTGDLDFSNVGRQQSAQNGGLDFSGLRGRRSGSAKGNLGGAKVQGAQNIPVTERDLNPGRFVSADKKRRLQNNSGDVDADFSFGKILKYIIILIIGFSILFFVGSQLVAISRGNKKRN